VVELRKSKKRKKDERVRELQDALCAIFSCSASTTAGWTITCVLAAVSKARRYNPKAVVHKRIQPDAPALTYTMVECPNMNKNVTRTLDNVTDPKIPAEKLYKNF
jgi:hypothetical protein